MHGPWLQVLMGSQLSYHMDLFVCHKHWPKPSRSICHNIRFSCRDTRRLDESMARESLGYFYSYIHEMPIEFKRRSNKISKIIYVLSI